MRVVRGDLDNIIALTQLFALLVEHDTVLVESFRLSDDRHASARVGGAGLVRTRQRLINTRLSHELAELIARCQALRADARQVTTLRHVIKAATSGASRIKTRSGQTVAELVRVLADNITVLRLLSKFFFPSFHAIGRAFLLQSLEEGLVLERDLYQVLSSLLSIERLLGLVVGLIQTWLRVLHDV